MTNPHPLRQTSFPRDFASTQTPTQSAYSSLHNDNQTGDEEEDVDEEDWRRGEEDDFDVTRQDIRRGAEDEEDGDNEEDEEEDASGYFPAISIKIKPPRKESADVPKAETEEGDEELFPAPNAFGVDLDEEEFNKMAGDEDILLEMDAKPRKRRKVFGPGMSQDEVKYASIQL